MFLYVFLFSLSLFKLLHLQSTTTHIQHTTNRTTLRKTENKTLKTQNTTTEISQPEPEIYLFAVGSRAGYPVFMLFSFFLFLYVLFVFA